MAKKNTTYYCTACGYESSGWLGKCPSCGGWNTFEEKINIPKAKSGSGAGVGQGWLGDLLDEDSAKEETLLTLDKVHGEAASYFSSGINEFDRVLGGGLFRAHWSWSAATPA
jgi:DNA repair protein RadA/Sms